MTQNMFSELYKHLRTEQKQFSDDDDDVDMVPPTPPTFNRQKNQHQDIDANKEIKQSDEEDDNSSINRKRRYLGSDDDQDNEPVTKKMKHNEFQKRIGELRKKVNKQDNVIDALREELGENERNVPINYADYANMEYDELQKRIEDLTKEIKKELDVFFD